MQRIYIERTEIEINLNAWLDFLNCLLKFSVRFIVFCFKL